MVTIAERRVQKTQELKEKERIRKIQAREKRAEKIAKSLTKESQKPKTKKVKDKPKKKKKLSRSKLIKKLDSVFSEYVRRMNADRFGMVKCYTCDREHHRKDIQNGHFITRSCQKLRRDLANCRPQCYACNCILHGNYIQYTLRLMGEVGQDMVNYLVSQKHIKADFSYDYLVELLEFYKRRLAELEEVL